VRYRIEKFGLSRRRPEPNVEIAQAAHPA